MSLPQFLEIIQPARLKGLKKSDISQLQNALNLIISEFSFEQRNVHLDYSATFLPDVFTDSMHNIYQVDMGLTDYEKGVFYILSSLNTEVRWNIGCFSTLINGEYVYYSRGDETVTLDGVNYLISDLEELVNEYRDKVG